MLSDAIETLARAERLHSLQGILALELADLATSYMDINPQEKQQRIQGMADVLYLVREDDAHRLRDLRPGGVVAAAQ